MQDPTLVPPMFALVLLSAVTLVRLFTGRVASVRAGQADLAHFKTFQVGQETRATAQLSRNFVNQFETPTLFYAVCVVLMVAGPSSTPVTALAWGYVLARCAHSFVHTTSNAMNARIATYMASWLCLLALWIAALVRTAAA